jgi:hypothetical protein
VPDANDGTAASVTYRAWDQTSGAAGDLADATTNGGASAFSAGVDVATLSVAAVNDAPTATIVSVSYAATEQTALDLAGTGLSIADVDAGAGNITTTLSVVSGALTVTAGSTGVSVSGSGTSTVTLIGTVDQINDLLAGNLGATASYIISGDAPPPTDSLTLSVDDGGNAGAGTALTASVTRTIAIAAVNDAPTATIVPASFAATEQTALDLAGTGLSIGDVDAGAASVTAMLSVVSGTLTVTAGTSGVSVSGSGTSMVLLTGTVAQINDLLAGNLGATASYILSADATPATDSLTLSVNDGGNAGTGGALIASVSRTIAITAINDAPTATIASASYAATEQTALDLAGTGLSIGDVDAGAAGVTATLSVVSGTLTVTAGTSGVSVSGSGTSTVVLTGTVDQINDLLGGNLGATASYIIDADTPPATDALTLSVDDGGHVGAGGALSASVTRTIAIAAVDDAPLIAAPAGITINVDQPTALHGISFADPDAGSGILTATVTVDRGALSGISDAGVTVAGSGSILTLSGTLADLNGFIAAGSLGFVTAPGDVTPVSLGVAVNDGGSSGGGGSLSSATAIVTLSVLPIPGVRPPVESPGLDGQSQDGSPGPSSDTVGGSPANTVPAPESAAAQPASTPSSGAQAGAPLLVVNDAADASTSEPGAAVLSAADRPSGSSAGSQASGNAGQEADASPGTPRWARSDSSSAGVVPDRRSSEQRLLDLLRVAFDQAKPEGTDSAATQRAAADTPNQTDFIQGLDRLRDGVQNDARIERTAITSMAAAGIGLSVGYVAWLLRAGALLSSLLSSLPAWRMLDPLPVLARQKGGDALDDDDETLESLVDRDETAQHDREPKDGEISTEPETLPEDRHQSRHGTQS